MIAREKTQLVKEYQSLPDSVPISERGPYLASTKRHLAESKHHHERFLSATTQGHMELDTRVYLVNLDGDMHDLRGQKATQPLVYHNDNFSAGHHLARTLREAGSNGIAYDSVRRTGGECAAVFRPPLLSNARQERHLCYVWNGQQIVMVYEKREFGNKGIEKRGR